MGNGRGWAGWAGWLTLADAGCALTRQAGGSVSRRKESDDAGRDLRDDARGRVCGSRHAACAARGNGRREVAGAQPAAGACGLPHCINWLVAEDARVCSTVIVQLEALYALLDDDGDGALTVHEMIDLFVRHATAAIPWSQPLPARPCPSGGASTPTSRLLTPRLRAFCRLLRAGRNQQRCPPH